MNPFYPAWIKPDDRSVPSRKRFSGTVFGVDRAEDGSCVIVTLRHNGDGTIAVLDVRQYGVGEL